MSRTVYVNGDYVPETQARVSVFDRGFLFADAIYEVCTVLDGKLIDAAGHLARLDRSLGELRMQRPCDDEQILQILRTLRDKNQLQEGLIYLQISRTAADRGFAWQPDSATTVVAFTQAMDLLNAPQARDGIRVITLPDLRWHRRDIKTTNLLYACMAKVAARDAGADDAWLVENGAITEGTSNNAYIVTPDNTIVTHKLGHDILAGCTRAALLALAREEGLQIEERSFSEAEIATAREAFITSASSFCWPVVAVNDQPVADGKPGPLARRLRELYIAAAREKMAS
ncbi:D-amino-acid transaminase [Granulosicoccaceae sp. 1_MG-2023]|nr:D-amino-acid transaminase [Granulosicoccaceae sp. 1_MG-2023]